MKQNYKIQHVLEDPKQATIQLALPLQLKQDGVSKKVLKVLVAQRALKLQYLKVFGGIFLYIKVEKNFEVLQL